MCATLASMPRTWGESACSTVWWMRRSPSARTVSLCRLVFPSGLRTRVMRRDFGCSAWVSLGLWLSIFLPIPEGRQVLHVFAAPPGLDLRILELLQSAQRGVNHVQHV